MEATIVLAEDDADLRVVYAQWLRRAGHRVWEAADGGAVQGVGLKVVVLSHQGDSDTRLEGFALGVVDYWTKDLSLAELSARIESVLESPSPATESAVND